MLVVTAALAGKVIGFVREVAVAHAFGTGIEYDAFLAGITVPAAICTILDYGAPNLLVPLYAAKRALPASFRLGALITAVALIVALVVFAPAVVSLVTPGLSSATSAWAARVLRAYSGMVLLGLLSSVGMARLQGRRLFTRPALGPIVLNLVVLAGVLVLSGRLGTFSLVWGMSAGTVLLAIWYWWPAKEQHDQAEPARESSSLAPPLGMAAIGVLAAVVIGQLFFVVDRWWGSYLEPGSISALLYAITITNIPVAVIGTGLAVAIFPFLHASLAAPDPTEGRRILERAVRYIIWIGVPLAVMFGLFGEPLIGLLLERGRFDARSTELTAGLLPLLALGMVFYAATAIWEKVYYARRRVWRLVVVMGVVFTGKVLLSWLFVSSLGIRGLALATGLSYIGCSILLYLGIDRAYRPPWQPTLTYLVKVLLLAFGSGVIGYMLCRVLIPTPGPSVTAVRMIQLLLGGIFIWVPLLMIDGHWGISERRRIIDALCSAIGRK